MNKDLWGKVFIVVTAFGCCIGILAQWNPAMATLSELTPYAPMVLGFFSSIGAVLGPIWVALLIGELILRRKEQQRQSRAEAEKVQRDELVKRATSLSQYYKRRLRGRSPTAEEYWEAMADLAILQDVGLMPNSLVGDAEKALDHLAKILAALKRFKVDRIVRQVRRQYADDEREQQVAP